MIEQNEKKRKVKLLRKYLRQINQNIKVNLDEHGVVAVSNLPCTYYSTTLYLDIEFHNKNKYGEHLLAIEQAIEHGWSQYIIMRYINTVNRYDTDPCFNNICLGPICKTADQLVLDGHYEEALDIVIAIVSTGKFSMTALR